MRRPLCSICLAVIVLVALYTGLHPPETISYETVSGRMVQVTGQVYAKEYKKGKEFPILVLFLKPNELICNQQKIPFLNNFICTMVDGGEEPSLGSYVCIRGIFTEFEKASNPGQFDQSAYYATLGISAQINKCTVVAESVSHHPVKEFLWEIRKISSGLFYRIFPQEDAAILSTMLLGDKSGLMSETRDLYKDAGILHILSISGLHISVLGMGLFRVLRKWHIPSLPACVISGILMLAYGFMVGMPVSAMRAIGMFLIRLLAVILKRTYDMLTALFLCAALTVISEPYLLYQTGFLLSYLAVLAILVFMPAIIPPLKKPRRWLDGLFTSLSISIFTLPVQLYFFYEVSIYSPILNLMILPLTGGVMVAGLLCLPLQVLTPPLAQVAVMVVHMILNAFSEGAEFLCGLPGAMWVPGKPSLVQIVIFYGIVLIILFLKKLRYRYKMGLLCGAILILTIRFSTGLSVTFLDIGQGDCTVVKLPQGQVWLIDGGSSTVSEVGTYRMEPFLKSMGISTLDAVFLSHGDTDHISGVEDMLVNGDIKIKMLVLPCTGQAGGESKSGKVNEFDFIKSVADKQKIPIMWLSAGMEWKSGEVSVQCLHPNEAFSALDSNAASQVLYLEYGEVSTLFTGDLEGEGEQKVLEALKERGINHLSILKVAHHGSKNSTSEDFLNVLKPKYAVISCARKNSYGHPHEVLLNRLRTVNACILCTMENGAVTFTTDGKELKRKCKNY